MKISDELAALMQPAKVLTVDLELSPAICMSWGIHEQRLSTESILEPSRMLCFAAKWLHQDRVMFFSERGGRQEMVESAWRLYDEADVVVGYNHQGFDNKHFSREWLLAGLQAPSPWIDIDLLKVMRKNFKFMSNKLGFVTESLGIGSKLDSGGLKTWRDVMDGDEAAWRRMEKYNRQDVRVSEELFIFLRGFIKLPHSGLFSGNMSGCFDCGSSRLEPDGVVRSGTAAYVRLSCGDCGAWNKLLPSGETRSAR